MKVVKWTAFAFTQHGHLLANDEGQTEDVARERARQKAKAIVARGPKDCHHRPFSRIYIRTHREESIIT